MASPDRWVLKGGVALEFRLGNRARMTRDLDLAGDGPEEDFVRLIVEASEIDPGDYFTFIVAQLRSVIVDDEERALRFRVTTELGG